MNIVFSFRTKPSLMRRDNEWRSPYYMLRALGLAVQEAKKFGPVKFYTDTFGHKLLSAMNLDIEIVDSLEHMNSTVPTQLYTVSKLWVYRDQEEPFIHMDFDAFAFKIDESLMRQPIFTMFRESTGPQSCYPIVDRVVADDSDHCPQSWREVVHKLQHSAAIPYAANMGVWGVNDLDFNQAYCSEAIDFLTKDRAYIMSKSIQEVKWINVAIEQYTVNSLAWSRGMEMAYMFNEGQFQIWNDKMPHLLAAEKLSVEMCRRVDKLSPTNVDAALELWTNEQAHVLKHEVEVLC
jgi:hypothetical protein